jgi:hypothetical protein
MPSAIICWKKEWELCRFDNERSSAASASAFGSLAVTIGGDDDGGMVMGDRERGDLCLCDGCGCTFTWRVQTHTYNYNTE